MCIPYLPPVTKSPCGVAPAATAPGSDPQPGSDPEMGFYWASMSDSVLQRNEEKPVGHSAEEARVVAWMMSCFPYTCDDREVNALMEHVDIQRELNTKHEGQTLYSYLVAKGERDVDIAVLESDFKHVWCFHPENKFNDDPCYLRQVAADVRRSVEAFVINLDQACMSIAGMDPGQISSSALTEQMMKVRSCAAHELTQMLISKDSTKESMVDRIKDIEDRFSESVVRAHKKELETAFSGVTALAAICAAVIQNREFIDILQVNFAAARDVCAYPPKHLTEQLALVGLSTSILRSCFLQPTGRVVGGSSLAPSSSRVVDMITEFFRCGDVAYRFSTACVAVLNLLRLEIATPDNSEVWSGVDVVDSTSQGVDALRIVSPECVSAVRGPSHSSSSTNLFLVVPNRTCRALRAVRFLCALRKAVAIGALTPRLLRASILLASVARFRSDKRFRASAIERETLCPLAERAEIAFPFGNSEYSETQNEEISPSTTGDLVFAVPEPLEVQQEACVPLQLQRDYAIMKCFDRMIPERGGIVTLKQIGKTLMSQGGYFCDHSERSVEQSVSWVVKKCEEKARAKMLTDGRLEYIKAAPGMKGGGSISIDEMGARALSSFLRNTLSSMENADAAFMKEWHVSRSSRNKAKTAATSKAVGVPQSGQKRSCKA